MKAPLQTTPDQAPPVPLPQPAPPQKFPPRWPRAATQHQRQLQSPRARNRPSANPQARQSPAREHLRSPPATKKSRRLLRAARRSPRQAAIRRFSPPADRTKDRSSRQSRSRRLRARWPQGRGAESPTPPRSTHESCSLAPPHHSPQKLLHFVTRNRQPEPHRNHRINSNHASIRIRQRPAGISRRQF